MPRLDAATFADRFEADNPQFAVIDAGVDERRADVVAAGLWPNPSLSYERETLYPDAGSEIENRLALGWTVDLSGRRSRRQAAARHRVAAAAARGEQAKVTALLDALAAYDDAALARLRVEVLREGRAPLARMVDALTARVKAGDAAGHHLERLELELASYDQRLATAQDRLTAHQLMLGGLLGEPDSRYDAADELALPTVPAGAEELTRRALVARGDYRATARELAGAEAALAATARWWVPRIDLGVGIRTVDLGPDSATGYVATVGVDIPILSRGQGDAARARARRRVARAERAQLERLIASEVRVARQRLVAAVARARSFGDRQLALAASLVGKTEKVYSAGEASVVELVDAYRTAVETRLRYLELRRQARAARRDLARLTGAEGYR